jgi:hypothetical protein
MEKEEAMEILKGFHDESATFSVRAALETLHPELKEGEDERTRKAILTGLIDCRDAPDLGWSNFGGINIDECIAWIKKQGGKKPTDKVEPKFKVGDWVFIEEVKGYKNGPFQIKTMDSFGYSFDEYHTIPFMYEELLSKWTIQDAKDGDVLVNGNEIVIFKKSTFNEKDLSGSMFVYCRLRDKKGYWYTIGGINPTNYTPATKVQYDILFVKMKEAGYEWDADKKELKMVDWNKHIKYNPNAPSIIKENPAWSEEDEEFLRRATNAAKDVYPMTANWLKSLKERCAWKPSDEQIKVCKEVYADLLSAKGFDVGTINSELNRLEEKLKGG